MAGMLGMKNTMIFGFGGSQFVWGDHYGTSSFQCNMPSDIIETELDAEPCPVTSLSTVFCLITVVSNLFLGSYRLRGEEEMA